MNPGRWFRKSWARLRRRRLEERPAGALREFVYLDEVSVYSLLASRLGAVPTEFTATESDTLRGELNSAIGASGGVAKAEVGSAIESSRTTGTQVVRKSIVQSAFKHMYDLEESALALRPVPASDQPPAIQGVDDLLRLADSDARSWVVDSKALRRGQMIEVNAQLDAEDIYRVSITMCTLLNFMEEIPQLASMADQEGLLDAITGTRLLDQLLAGLVPLRGIAIDYRHAVIEGRHLIVHNGVLSQLSVEERPEVEPVHVVGVAEADLFWKDIRRLLYSGGRYSVLGRLGRDGAQSEWAPVKLLALLEQVVPDLQSSIEAMASVFETTTESEHQAEERQRTRSQAALVVYASDLARHYGKTCSAEDLAAYGLPSAIDVRAFAELQGRRIAFRQMTEHLVEVHNIPREPEIAAMYRAAALLDVGLELDGSIPGTEDLPGPASETGPSERFLDTEIVAIYW